jgi:nucleoside-diphosphate-sugar epimerase
LTDLADKNSIERVFHRYRPQILFHAGTWRHLHFTERQPLDAVRANFLTVRWLAEMADKTGMEKFIFLSTLKAAYLRSYFSVIHKMAELYLHEIATRGKTRSISVRVGNILGEETHFVKVLRREILEKGTATLPIPDKGFWFLSADKAAQLVIKAGGMGDGGEVFSLDRGRRITMRGIAEDLQKGAKGAESFSLFPGTGVVRDIEFIPDASKWDPWLIEELSMEEGPCPEKKRPTAFSDIQVVETKSYGWDQLRGELDEIEALVEKGDEKGLKERLRVYFPLAIPAQGE